MEQHEEQPDIVTQEFGGKWVAWDEDARHIVAYGNSYEEAKEKAQAAGVKRPVLEKVPPADAAFAGGL